MTDTVLKIYRAPSGQWSGIFVTDGDEVARIAGCESALEVENFACEGHPDYDRIEIRDEAGIWKTV